MTEVKVGTTTFYVMDIENIPFYYKVTQICRVKETGK